MADHFWVVKTERSIVDLSFHYHVIYRLTKPDNLVAGPFSTEDKAIDWLNYYAELGESPDQPD